MTSVLPFLQTARLPTPPKQFQWNTPSIVKSIPTLDTTEMEKMRYYILPNGSTAISMTTLLGAMVSDKKISEWKKKVGEEKAAKISLEATNRGKNYHSLMESYLQNQLKEDELDPFQIETLTNARKRVDKIDNVMCIEKSLFSETYRIAGTVDCIAEYDGVLSIIDHKTAARPKKEEWIQNYFLQETGYSLMFEELTGIKIDQIVTIISVKDSHYPPQVFIKKSSDYKDQLIRLIEEFYVTNPPNRAMVE